MGAGCTKPGSVSAFNSPESTYESFARPSAHARAARSSRTGMTSVAPCASAATIVVVAKRMSSTTTTLPASRTVSSSSLFVRTWILFLSLIGAATSGAGAPAEKGPAFERQDKLALLVHGLPQVLDQPDGGPARRG